jgi:DNA-binding response OmpR family regulator
MHIWRGKRILLISYNEQLLIARRVLLEEEGYNVSSALGLKEALANCNDSEFDLLILGHSIPLTDKEGLISTFRAHSSAPILSLWEKNEVISNSVDYLTFTDTPEKLLGHVATILTRRASSQRSEAGN